MVHAMLCVGEDGMNLEPTLLTTVGVSVTRVLF
jgi:hypothetical protein